MRIRCLPSSLPRPAVLNRERLYRELRTLTLKPDVGIHVVLHSVLDYGQEFMVDPEQDLVGFDVVEHFRGDWEVERRWTTGPALPGLEFDSTSLVWN
jgi:hypothetical protein